jgi:hypothetical protein
MDRPQPTHIPRTSSRIRPSFRTFGGCHCATSQGRASERPRSSSVGCSHLRGPLAGASRQEAAAISPFQLKSISRLIPTLLQNSATGIPYLRDLRMNECCASVTLHAFNVPISSPSQGRLAESFGLKLSVLRRQSTTCIAHRLSNSQNVRGFNFKSFGGFGREGLKLISLLDYMSRG